MQRSELEQERDRAAELDALRAENARLREALEKIQMRTPLAEPGEPFLAGYTSKRVNLLEAVWEHNSLLILARAALEVKP